jgi:hypothetical protein
MRRLFLVSLAVMAALIASQVVSVLTGPQPIYGEDNLTCDQDGIKIAYETAYSPAPDPGYKVTAFVVSDIHPDCRKYDITVSVWNDSTPLASSDSVRIGGESVRVAVGAPALASLVTRVQVSIDDNRPPAGRGDEQDGLEGLPPGDGSAGTGPVPLLPASAGGDATGEGPEPELRVTRLPQTGGGPVFTTSNRLLWPALIAGLIALASGLKLLKQGRRS